MAEEMRTFLPGEILFRQNDFADGLYFIEEGSVEIYLEKNETIISLGKISRGEFLGTVTLLSGDTRAAGARAQTKVIVRYYNRDTFMKTIDTLPAWARAVIKDITKRLRDMNEKVLQSTTENEKLKAELELLRPKTRQN